MRPSRAGWLLGSCPLLVGCIDLSDLNSGTQAQPDASPDAPAGLLCSASHDLCDDFDAVPLGDPSRWTSFSVQGAVTADLVTDPVRSAPKAFRAALPQNDTMVGQAFLVRNLPGGTGVRCSFSIQVHLDSTGSSDVGIHVWGITVMPAAASAVSSYSLDWYMFDDPKSDLDETTVSEDGGAGTETDHNFSLPKQDAWTDVVVDLNGSQLSVTYDGATVLTTSTVAPSIQSAAVSFGIYGGFPHAHWQLVYDNVVCDHH